MKKLILVASLCFVSQLAFAQTFECEVVGPNISVNWPKSYVQFETSADRVENVSYVYAAPECDGTHTMKRETLYSASTNVRGGYDVEYCNPDKNEFFAESESVELSTVCVPTHPALDGVSFEMKASSSGEGYFQTQTLQAYSKAGPTTRRILFYSCHLVGAR